MGQDLYSIQLEKKYGRAQPVSTPRRSRRRSEENSTNDVEVPRVPPNSADSLTRERTSRIQFRDTPESPPQRTARSRAPRSPSPWMLSHANGPPPAPFNMFDFPEIVNPSPRARPEFWRGGQTGNNHSDETEGLVDFGRSRSRYSGNDDPFSDDYERDTQSADSDSDDFDESSRAWTLEGYGEAAPPTHQRSSTAWTLEGYGEAAPPTHQRSSSASTLDGYGKAAPPTHQRSSRASTLEGYGEAGPLTHQRSLAAELVDVSGHNIYLGEGELLRWHL